MSWTGMNDTIAPSDMPSRGHSVGVRWTSSNHGRPFRAYCTCGWMSSMNTSRDAARILGDEHVQHSERAR